MSSTELTIDDLKKFQDNMMDSGKRILIEQKHLIPMFFVMTRKMEIDPWLRGTVLDARTMAPPEKMDEMPGEYIVLMIPSDWHDPETLLHMIKYLCDDPVKAELSFAFLRMMAPSYGVPSNPTEHIVKVFQKMTGMSPKNIIASFVKKLCQKTEAVAYVQVCEAWLRDNIEDRSAIPEDLHDDPEAQEVLMCSMETNLKYTRFIREHFQRSEREKGDIIGWGKKEVMEDTEENGNRLTGRFFGFIRQDRNDGPPSAEAPSSKG